MNVRTLRSFERDARAQYRRLQNVDAVRATNCRDALDVATAELAGTRPGFETAYPLSRESGTLPDGPYRDKLFGPGKRPTYRPVFRVTPAAVELVAVRHLSQDDLTALDL